MLFTENSFVMSQNRILSGDIAYDLVSISGKPNCCSYWKMHRVHFI